MTPSALLEVVAMMRRLRAECGWKAAQTHRSLARHLLEETYEAIEAIEALRDPRGDSGDRDHLREELGDLLMQVYFHARIAEETPREHGGFDLDDVARGIVDKLVHRHPHVFAGVDVADAAAVERNWERLKAAEKQRSGPTEGIPVALPALAYADKVLSRFEKTGGSVQLPPGDGVGERLLALVQEARAAGVDAESELRRITRAWADAGS
jgi:XTP/dITP diphosphohydrolase